MERVSILLGHSSVKITERQYTPSVRAHQSQLETDLEWVWRKDPLVQAEIIDRDTAVPDTPLRTVATYSRHETARASLTYG
jgi:hypothetical protein